MGQTPIENIYNSVYIIEKVIQLIFKVTFKDSGHLKTSFPL